MPVEDPGSSTIDSAATTLGGLNAALTINVKGLRSWSIWIGASLVGTVTFEATIDDTNWQTINLMNGAGALVGSVVNPAGDIYSAPNYRPAFSQVRARVSAYTSGSTTSRSRTHPR
jgi:hypothetical protein